MENKNDFQLVYLLSKLWDATKQKVKGKNLIAEDIKKMKSSQ